MYTHNDYFCLSIAIYSCKYQNANKNITIHMAIIFFSMYLLKVILFNWNDETIIYEINLYNKILIQVIILCMFFNIYFQYSMTKSKTLKLFKTSVSSSQSKNMHVSWKNWNAHINWNPTWKLQQGVTNRSSPWTEREQHPRIPENLRKPGGCGPRHRFWPVQIPAMKSTKHCFNWHQRNRILSR